MRPRTSASRWRTANSPIASPRPRRGKWSGSRHDPRRPHVLARRSRETCDRGRGAAELLDRVEAESRPHLRSPPSSVRRERSPAAAWSCPARAVRPRLRRGRFRRGDPPQDRAEDRHREHSEAILTVSAIVAASSIYGLLCPLYLFPIDGLATGYRLNVRAGADGEGEIEVVALNALAPRLHPFAVGL